jgi:hypothetical protein
MDTMQDSSAAAIVCPHVARDGRPILYAERSEPVNAEDSGWQFLCNSVRSEDPSQAQVWSLDEVLVLEPSLRSVIVAPPGTRVYRRDKLAAWEEHRSAVH